MSPVLANARALGQGEAILMAMLSTRISDHPPPAARIPVERHVTPHLAAADLPDLLRRRRKHGDVPTRGPRLQPEVLRPREPAIVILQSNTFITRTQDERARIWCRERWFHQDVLDGNADHISLPDAFYFNPGMNAASFKSGVLKSLLVGFNTVDRVDVYENENISTYESVLTRTAEAVRRDIEVVMHGFHEKPVPLSCGPEDFGIESRTASMFERWGRLLV